MDSLIVPTTFSPFNVSPLLSLFLQGSSKDIGQLAAALHHRILALKSRAEQEPETPAATIPVAEVPQSNEDDSDEDDNASASASASTPATSQFFLFLSLCLNIPEYLLTPNVKIMLWIGVCGFVALAAFSL